jgi:hypothetical protein
MGAFLTEAGYNVNVKDLTPIPFIFRSQRISLRSTWPHPTFTAPVPIVPELSPVQRSKVQGL